MRVTLFLMKSLLIACLILVAGCGGGSASLSSPPEHELNSFIIAATASSFESRRFVPECAFDADSGTRWASVFKDGEWVEAKFAGPVSAKRIVVLWESARAADYTILGRLGDGPWAEIGSKKGAAGSEDRVDLTSAPNIDAMRIRCDRRATGWGNSILDIRVFGSTDAAPPSASLSGWKIPPTPQDERDREAATRLLAAAAADPASCAALDDDAFLDLVQRRAFDYFWHETDSATGLTRDRGRNFASSEEIEIASIAASGWTLSAYVIGAERGWVKREDALSRAKATLRTLADGPVRNVNGFFPHFVDVFTGKDQPGTEISTIDTVLFLAGMLTAMEYFGDSEVTALATRIYERIDWNWARDNDAHLVSMGVDAGGKFLPYKWGSAVDESPLVYLLGLGSPTHPLPDGCWDALSRQPGFFDGFEFMTIGGQQTPLFLYPALWYDFRGRKDKSGMDFHANAATALLAMREYCIQQAKPFPGCYGPELWGLGPADGPGDKYVVYGFPPGTPPMDGTVIPYVAGGAVPILPNHAIRTLRKIYDEGRRGWGKYGFPDSLNLGTKFFPRDVIGIDQGTILLGIENHRSGLIRRLFSNNSWIREATRRIGWTQRPRPEDPGGPLVLEKGWRVKAGDGDYAKPETDDRDWMAVAMPDRWEHHGGTFAGYDGIGWYRVRFTLDATRLKAWQRGGRSVVLTLGAVDDADVAYLNGREIGKTAAGPDIYRKARRYAVPAGALKAGENVLAVRVDDTGGAGGIWTGPLELGPVAK